MDEITEARRAVLAQYRERRQKGSTPQAALEYLASFYARRIAQDLMLVGTFRGFDLAHYTAVMGYLVSVPLRPDYWCDPVPL